MLDEIGGEMTSAVVLGGSWVESEKGVGPGKRANTAISGAVKARVNGAEFRHFSPRETGPAPSRVFV